jgi:hypothetical protein
MIHGLVLPLGSLPPTGPVGSDRTIATSWQTTHRNAGSGSDSPITASLYTAAQQTADWGAPLGPGDTLALRIFQLSARLGRGAPASIMLQF